MEWYYIIAAAVAVSTAVLGWVKWIKRDSKKPVEKTQLFTAIKGNDEIYQILQEVQNECPNVVKAGMIETTNGGGIPQIGRLTYKRVVASTDPTVFRIFGEKTPNDASYNKIILDTLVDGETMWEVSDMKDPLVLDLFKSTHVTGGMVIMLKIEEGIRLLAFVVDFRDSHRPNAEERNFLREKAAEIRKILDRNEQKVN